MNRKETAPGQPDPKAIDGWLKKANDAQQTSISFSDTNWRKQWTNNLRMFQNKHILGSKYNTEAYKYRSKLFRPKTRTSIRNTEAAGAAAFFSSMDVVSIQPVGESDIQKAGAKFIKELTSYHLAQPEMHWFLTVIGGLQDAQKMGVCCSYNYWKETAENEDGSPCVELTPIDRILFHPGANWIDPINTSPYVIRRIPMFVQEVKEREDWETPTNEEFQNALIGFDEDLTNARNKNQENPQQANVPNLTDFSMVWVNEVFMREKGKDMVFYTLGTVKRLTTPQPRAEVYWHNERPITLGYYIIESHRAMAPGVPEVGEQLQREANEIANSRQDNVKLALNKRYLIKRGAQVDIRSLLRNAAGSATVTNNPESDVKELQWNDVTRSSYEEQNRVDVDFDDLVGGFNAGTIKNQRSLNETVGGLSMLQSSAGQITDYGLKTFSETWMEPTLRQVAKLIQFYESDATAIGVAAEKAEIALENAAQLEQLMSTNLLLTVDIGVGTSNPGFRLERFISGINSFISLVKNATPGMDIEEIGSELFGYLGYKDGSRFFNMEENPQIQELTQTVQQLQQELQSKIDDHQAKLATEQLKADSAMERQQDQNAFELVKAALDAWAEDNQVQMNGMQERFEDIMSRMSGDEVAANG
jgi:hypothetical protein